MGIKETQINLTCYTFTPTFPLPEHLDVKRLLILALSRYSLYSEQIFCTFAVL